MITFSTDGWYIVRVDTGIGEQYACVQITKPLGTPRSPVAATWNPIDGLSSHYMYLVSGPDISAEAAWATWNAPRVSIV